MSDIKVTGKFDLYLLRILPSGVDTRAVEAEIGGGLWRAFDKYGVAGMPMDAIDTGKPEAAVPAIPAGAIRMEAPPAVNRHAYPDVSTNPGSPADELDDALDERTFQVVITVAKSLGSYQVLKDWCVALGGAFEPLPVRPV